MRSAFHPAGTFDEDVCAASLLTDDATSFIGALLIFLITFDATLFADDELTRCIATGCDITLDMTSDEIMEELDDDPETSGVGVVTCVHAARRRIMESAMSEVVRIEEEYNKKSAAAATLFL